MKQPNVFEKQNCYKNIQLIRFKPIYIDKF